MLLESNLGSLLSQCIPKNIQCSNEKREGYKKGVSKYIAIDKYKFIQLAHPMYYKMISVDIDEIGDLKSIIDVIDYLNETPIPEPTIIVKTDRGFHIHWAFNSPMWKNNTRLMQFRKLVLKEISKYLNIDINFSGFIMRNPKLHDSYYSGAVYDYDDFIDLVDINTIEYDDYNSQRNKRIYSGNKKHNFEETEVGHRNEVLVSYLRQYCFVNFDKVDDKALIKEALRVNNKFKEPQPENEVISVAKSIYNFCKTNYDEKYVAKHTIDKNMELARKKAEKTYKKMCNVLEERILDKKIDVSKVNGGGYSINYIAIILMVSKNTYKKYREKLIGFVAMLAKKYGLNINVYVVTYSEEALQDVKRRMNDTEDEELYEELRNQFFEMLKHKLNS